jgi:polyisoprenoid-binding protein YceI
VKRIPRTTRPLLATFCLSIASCSSRLSPPPPALPAPPTNQQTALNRFTPANTQITFIGSALLASHQGTFTQFSGDLTSPDPDPAHAKLHLQIQMDSVFTKIPLLTRHLKQSDFFDVVTFPVADFVSTQITSTAHSPGDVQITGNLNLHGVTRAITFPAHFDIAHGLVTIRAGLTIRQSDFAMQSARITTDDVPVRFSATVPCKTPTTGYSDPAP